MTFGKLKKYNRYCISYAMCWFVIYKLWSDNSMHIHPFRNVLVNATTKFCFIVVSFKIYTPVSAFNTVGIILPYWHVSLVLNAYWEDFCSVWLVNKACRVTHPSPAQQDAKVTASWMQLPEFSSNCASETSGSCSGRTYLNKPERWGDKDSNS